MNSIDNLRDYVLTAPSICSTTRAILVGYIDGIEREVADMVPLPVDADGVPIHVGDVMEGYQLTIEVGGISWDGESWSLVDVCGTRWHDCAAFSHHHAPTVEDVLEEFVARWMETHHDDIPALKAEYAARLRLAGEDA